MNIFGTISFFKFVFLIGAVFLGLSLTACAPSTRNIPAVKNFNVERYTGKWYEIARLPNRFEKGMTHVTAEYLLRDDGKITVVNKGYASREGVWKAAEGKAYLRKTAEGSAELRVSFFWFFYVPYRVIWINDDYTVSVVTSSRKNYLWILSREHRIDDAFLQELFAFAGNHGFETGKAIFPVQLSDHPL